MPIGFLAASPPDNSDMADIKEEADKGDVRRCVYPVLLQPAPLGER